MNKPISWRSIYTTYRFCGHGRIWAAWRGWRYLCSNRVAALPAEREILMQRRVFLEPIRGRVSNHRA